jgi:alpha-galactosidase
VVAESGDAPVVTAANGVWMLSTRGASYVIGLGEDDAPRQLYWGPRLDPTDLAHFALTRRDRWVSTFERPAEADEELPVERGRRWGQPSLQVVFPDHVRGLELSFDAAEILADGLELRLRDATRAIAVTLHYRVRHDFDIIERWVSVTNEGAEDARVLRADSGRWLMPDLPGYRVSTVRGHYGGESQVSRDALPYGDLRIGSRLGVTGHASNPWMVIDDGSATEGHGETWTVALAWSGSWLLTAQHRPEGAVSVAAGMGHDDLAYRVSPGQTLTTPSTLGHYGAAGFGGASRAWHDYIRGALLPHGDEVRPVMYNSWEATHFAVDQTSQEELARKARALGVELFVVDDGWFSGRNSDDSGLGDWFPDAVKFPSGLRPLVTTVHELGMLFGLWVEPEMVNVKSRLYAEHPDWIYHWPDRTATEMRNQRVLNLARPDVQEHVYARLDELVSANEIDFLKWDMNRPFTEVGWPQRLNDSDWAWIEHTRRVYAIIDRLRAAHPRLRIESCASGGGRVDLGILSRTDQVWPSDNTDALDRQVIQHGYSQLYPANTMSSWVTDSVNLMTGRAVPLRYRFHVAMAGVLGIGADIATWNAQEADEASALIKQYKQVRRTVQFGRQYRLLGVPGREASAIQYVDDEQVILLTYEPHRSLSVAPRWVRLRGLDPAATYVLEETGRTFSAAYLSGHGVPFNDALNDRGWNNLRFSNRDYLSHLTVLRRAG